MEQEPLGSGAAHWTAPWEEPLPFLEPSMYCPRSSRLDAVISGVDYTLFVALANLSVRGGEGAGFARLHLSNETFITAAKNLLCKPSERQSNLMSYGAAGWRVENTR